MTNLPKDVPVKSVKKALSLLSILLFEDFEGRGMRLKDLAAQEGLSIKTAHNLLQTMTSCGFVEKTRYGNYAAGGLCRAIAYNNQAATYRYQSRVTNILIKHSREIHLGMVFTILENNAWTTFVEIENNGTLYRASYRPPQRYYLYEAATGRVLYSFSTKEQQQILIDENGAPDLFWENYQSDAEEIRKRGYCIAYRARFGSYGYGVPVISAQGKLIGAVGVFAYPTEVDDLRERQILQHLKQVAKNIAELRATPPETNKKHS